MKFTNEQLRYRFKSLNLSYSLITIDDLNELRNLLDIQLSNNRDLNLSISDIFKSFFNNHLLLVHATIYIDGDYFKEREAISFNRDGFIGFAGWASSKNLEPILIAFNNWLDYMDFKYNKKRIIKDISFIRSDDYAVLETDEYYFYYGYEEIVSEIDDTWCFVVKKDGEIIFKLSENDIVKHNVCKYHSYYNVNDYLLTGIGIFLNHKEKSTIS